ncbi:DUF6449 domain-containing protein [Pelotomaculum terephthalicicum JT]|uniref:DUF6449 domain-containing protein n=1 Tax=Pelotomaculum terephthalicicum TaxID=206393 RepID=UPI0009CDBC33|nr:DUF6449 domain-containing protein [Pelotomaculum terephthalicicum]MCG9968956.1 DUF6449 domain-containing protein [Pelotomaculum terephthalicicum JT]OPY60131.1 MAG: hypothetical protein A4E56_02887 [Pelotomaculum sp. PtaU1.Bin065]
MKSKTSLINRGILLNDFKRFAWLGAGYLLVLLLSLPLKVLMLHGKLEEVRIQHIYTLTRMFQFDTNQSFLNVMALILVPVLTGLLLFRYLQDSQAADAAHALPVRRETLYNTHIAAGILLLFAPLILTALISWALAAGLGINEINGAILSWLYISLLINLLFFMTSAAVGMITGMTTLQGVLSYILLLLPSGLSLLLLHNINRYIYGFAYDYYLEKIEKLSPLIRLTEISIRPVPNVEIAVYLLSSIALYFAGRHLYQRRHIETAGNAITFEALRPLFKYSATFCFMLLLGSYFNSAQDSPGWTYFGYFLGSILAYMLIEILLNKSLQVFQWRSIRGYGVYALIMIGLIGLLHYDFTGYEKRLPALSEVKSIYLDNSFYALNFVPAQDPLASEHNTYSPLPVKLIFTEKDNIARIYSLHQKILANRLAEKDFFLSQRTKDYSEGICLAYEMKNGSHIYRQYKIAAPEYADILKPLYESQEYKEMRYSILGTNPADVDMIEISAFYANKKVRFVDPELIAQAVDALRRDIYDQTYEEMQANANKQSWAGITVYLKNNRTVDLSWEKSYADFEQWLKETGRYNQARLLPGDDITSAFVYRMTDLDKQEPDKPGVAINRDIPIPELEKKPGVLKITDPDKLELCLRNYSISGKQAVYKVVFPQNNGEIISGFFSEADAPSFVKEHFTPAKEPF